MKAYAHTRQVARCFHILEELQVHPRLEPDDVTSASLGTAVILQGVEQEQYDAAPIPEMLAVGRLVGLYHVANPVGALLQDPRPNQGPALNGSIVLPPCSRSSSARRN